MLLLEGGRWCRIGSCYCKSGSRDWWSLVQEGGCCCRKVLAGSVLVAAAAGR